MKVILYLYERDEVRYSELAKLIASRGTLGLVLREMEEEGIIQRRVVTSRPIQTYYTLTQKGQGGRQKDKRDREFTSEKRG
jgi:DNA-binding HxlR family transcriptional regulator